MRLGFTLRKKEKHLNKFLTHSSQLDDNLLFKMAEIKGSEEKETQMEQKHYGTKGQCTIKTLCLFVTALFVMTSFINAGTASTNKFNRFHITYWKSFSGGHDRGIESLFKSMGFGDVYEYTSLWDYSTVQTQYPITSENNKPIRSIRIEYSITRNIALGISFFHHDHNVYGFKEHKNYRWMMSGIGLSGNFDCRA